MTEADWLAASEPRMMLASLEGKASDRKIRLFACACCRRIRPHLREFGSRWIVSASEEYADDREMRKRLERAAVEADFAGIPDGMDDLEWVAAQTVQGLGEDLDLEHVLTFAVATMMRVGGPTHGYFAAEENERRAQADIVRDIFGPFAPVTAAPTWLTSTVVSLAEGIYQKRAFDRLPILADALQDAGCDNEDILAHCRNDGPHVRGCWVVDLLLGKQ